jgi:hypothetical protein
MGARLYSPVLGRFLSRDSFYGGNETSYGYPLDPIMNSDLSGTMNAKTRKLFRHIADFIGKALDLIGLIPFLGWICGFICDFLIAAAGLVEAVLYFAIGEVGKGWAAIVGVGLGLLGGRALKKIFGEIKPAWKRGAPAPIMKVLKASGLDRVFAMITMYITGFLDWVDEKSHHKKVA